MHDIVKFCVYFLLLLCCSKGSSSVEVTPDTVSVCPGELITFKCTTSVTLLRWTVTLTDKTRAPVELLLSPSTMEVVSEIPTHGLVFHAEWTSLSPPCSTFMTNASLALHNAQVKCTAAMTSDTSIIIMRGRYLKYCHIIMDVGLLDADIPAIQWLNVTNMNFNEDSATLTIEWNGRDHARDNTQYFIVITPPLSILNGSVSNFTTNTSSHSFTIPYNSQHTITVTATNCLGNTSTVNKTFNFSEFIHN